MSSCQRHIIVSEDELEMCVQDLHKIFVCGAEPMSSLTSVLGDIVQPLFSVLCFCSNGCAALSTYVHELLVIYFKNLNKSEALESLVGLVCDHSNNTTKQLCDDIVFETGDLGGVQIIYQSNEQLKSTSEDIKVESLCNLVKDLQAGGLAGDFLLYLLKNLTDILKLETGTMSGSSQLESEQKLLNIEDQQVQQIESIQKRLMILNLLATLSNSLDSSCMQSNEQILKFVKATLERGIEVWKHTKDDVFHLFESESLSMAMGLLTAIMTNPRQTTTEEEKMKMNELLPLLNELSIHHPESEIQDMATDLRIAIATREIVVSDLMRNKTAEHKHYEKFSREKTQSVEKPLIEVISECNTESKTGTSTTVKETSDLMISQRVQEKADMPESQNSHSDKLLNLKTNKFLEDNNLNPDKILEVNKLTNDKVNEPQTTKLEVSNLSPNSKLAEVFEELCHPEIPVRGHALLTLVKLVQSKDLETINHQDSVAEIFENNLAHTDTYLYLPSVNGLVAMADILPDKIIPRLAREFSNITENKSTIQSDLKLKVGEALVKTLRVLGDMIPKYKSILLPAVLCGVKDCDPLVRASSLSNLTEICCLLRFSLGSHIHEILSCCGSVLKFDEDVEVRKAAALVFTHLLQGVGKEAFKILDSGLKDVYRLLKTVNMVETDPVVIDHVTLALNELDDIMREALFPKQVLSKMVRVLSVD
ncbi:transport and Golgi organization protein 6 homolog isoform X2 [Patella vulgata]|nr:transport and Golgi organization protein 6 homolog isoform X2 [Patella vulgata]